MKKVLLAILLGGLTASANVNFYVQGDVGFTQLSAKDADGTDNLFDQRVTIGYDAGEFRLGLDYTNFSKKSDTGSQDNVQYNGSIKANAFGVSLIYDFEPTPSAYDFTSANNFVPYIGVRASTNRYDAKIETEGHNFSSSLDGEVTEFGIGVLAGMQYYVSDNIALNLGAEFTQGTGDVDMRQLGAKLGLRFTF